MEQVELYWQLRVSIFDIRAWQGDNVTGEKNLRYGRVECRIEAHAIDGAHDLINQNESKKLKATAIIIVRHTYG